MYQSYCNIIINYVTVNNISIINIVTIHAATNTTVNAQIECHLLQERNYSYTDNLAVAATTSKNNINMVTPVASVSSSTFMSGYYNGRASFFSDHGHTSTTKRTGQLMTSPSTTASSKANVAIPNNFKLYLSFVCLLQVFQGLDCILSKLP